MQDFEAELLNPGSTGLWIEFSDLGTWAGKSYIFYSPISD